MSNDFFTLCCSTACHPRIENVSLSFSQQFNVRLNIHDIITCGDDDLVAPLNVFACLPMSNKLTIVIQDDKRFPITNASCCKTMTSLLNLRQIECLSFNNLHLTQRSSNLVLALNEELSMK